MKVLDALRTFFFPPVQSSQVATTVSRIADELDATMDAIDQLDNPSDRLWASANGAANEISSYAREPFPTSPTTTGAARRWIRSVRREVVTQREAVTRRVTAAFLVLAGVGIGTWRVLRPQAASVTATNYLIDTTATHFSPDRAIDGKRETDWLMLDGTTGSLTVTFPRAQFVEQITIVNGINAPSFDRGVGRFRVHVKPIHGPAREVGRDQFVDPLDEQPRAVSFPRQQIQSFTIAVESYLVLGAGIAEISWR